MSLLLKTRNVIGLLSGVLFAATLVASPAHAAGDSSITPGNDVCEFKAAGLGTGSAVDPFVINTPKQLAEVDDCSNDSQTITGASGDGITITYTVASNIFNVDDLVTISGNDPSGYDSSTALRVTAVTGTSFSVKGSETGTFVSGGTAVSKFHYYKLNADITLSGTSSESWNDTRSANITGASGDGTTVTFTAANSFTAGQTVNISGVTPFNYDLGNVTIASANSTSFTVASSVTASYTSGGVANALGWKPIGTDNSFYGRFDGNGHTISGLRIHNNVTRVGLIATAMNSVFTDVIFDDILIDQSGTTAVLYAGALLGYGENLNISNVTASGDIIGSVGSVGMVAGDVINGSIKDINVAGTIGLHSENRSDLTHYNTTYDFRGGFNGRGDLGGAVGSSRYMSISNAHSTVDIDGTDQANDPSVAPLYSQNVGGLVGEGKRFGLITDVTYDGEIVGVKTYAGGIAGFMIYGDTHNASSSGSISFVADSNFNAGTQWNTHPGYLGGIYGYSYDGSIYDSNSTMDVLLDITSHASALSGIETVGVGGLMGVFDCCGDIVRSHATGDVTVKVATGWVHAVGGLLGANGCCGNVSGSSSTGDVLVQSTTSTGFSEVSEIGGFLGADWCCGSLEDSHSTGSVTVEASETGAPHEIGGFVGWMDSAVGTYKSYSTGDVHVTAGATNAGYDVGGFVGYSREGNGYSDSHSTGSVDAVNTHDVGAFLGNTQSGIALSDSNASGDVTTTFDGGVNAGGLIGNAVGPTSILRSSSTGNISATGINGSAENVGGLIGRIQQNKSIIVTDSFIRGNISGSSNVAGLIGNGDSTAIEIKNAYFSGSVTASGTHGVADAIANGAYSDASGTVVYDSTKAGSTGTVTHATAKTSMAMKAKDTFAALGYDFGTNGVWKIATATNDGYPYLAAPASTTDNSSGGGSSAGGAKIGIKKVGTVHFADGSSKLTKASKAALLKYAKTIKAKKYKKILVMGYTASRGNSDALVANQSRLSTLRANATVKYLAETLKKMKVKGVKFIATGAGAQHPLATNSTKKGQALNRRAEITAIG